MLGGAVVPGKCTHVVLLGMCVVVLGAYVGVWTSIAYPSPLVHNTEHDSRHVCMPAAENTDISHTATHDDTHGPGAVLVVEALAVVVDVVLGTGPNVVV